MVQSRFHSKTNNKSITTTLRVVVMLLFFYSCSKDKSEVVEVVFNPETTYTMRTTDAISLISDSGVTRYRIKTAEMLIYDKALEPYSIFPRGLYIEKFDTLLNAEAFLKADTAYNWMNKKLWKGIGNVEIKNLQGDFIFADTIWWDEQEGMIYSEKSYIRLQTESELLQGHGFRSNQDLTDVRIYNLFDGSFPVSEAGTEDNHQNDSTEALPENKGISTNPFSQITKEQPPLPDLTNRKKRKKEKISTEDSSEKIIEDESIVTEENSENESESENEPPLPLKP